MRTGDRVFASTNVIGTRTKYARGTATISRTYEGLCKALAVLWCAKMLDGVRDLLSKPDDARAGALQWWFERQWDSDRVFGLAGLTSVAVQTLSPANALAWIRTHPGTYQIRVPGHAIAVHVAGSDCYFYDSESGLWKYSDAASWEADIKAEYDDGSQWTIWKLAKE